jgi:hypothetical protein
MFKTYFLRFTEIVLKTSFLILNIHIINPGLCYNWYKQCSYAEPGILTSFIVDVCMFNVLMCEVIVRFVDICRIVGHQFIIMEAILLGWTLEKIKTFTVQLHCQSSSCWPRLCSFFCISFLVLSCIRTFFITFFRL